MYYQLKAINLSILFCFITTISFAQNSPEQVKKYALDIAKKYCSNAYEIIQQTEAEYIDKWMNNFTGHVIIQQFSTAVHESLHGYDNKIGFDKTDWSTTFNGYYINKDIKLKVPRPKVFHTAELHANYFPQEVKETFRYETYIYKIKDEVQNINGEEVTVHKGPSSVTANVEGIFGLLEEFNAYYHDQRACYELMIAALNNPDNPQFQHIRSEYIDGHRQTYNATSYYEFNIYMAYYLKYAKEKEPETYKKLMENKELRTAYTLIETNWRDLLTSIYSEEKIINFFIKNDQIDDIFNEELRAIMNGFMLDKSELPKYSTFFKEKKYNPQLIQSQRKKHEYKKPEIEPTNSFQLVLRANNYKYVVVYHSEDVWKTLHKWNDDIKEKYPDSGVYVENDAYYIFLKRFKTEKEAQKMANKVKNEFPDTKIY